MKTLLLQEHEKFSMTADNHVKLEKKVGNLGKVSILLKEKMFAFNWNSQGFKQSKTLLTVDEPLPGVPDNDPTPIVCKRGKAVASAQFAQAAAEPDQPALKRKMMTKETAPKRSKKLKQPRISMFLDDEDDEEVAANDAAGERQPASVGVGSTGPTNRIEPEGSEPLEFFNSEPLNVVLEPEVSMPA